MKHHIGAVVAAVTGAVTGVVVVVHMAVSGIISIHFSNEKQGYCMKMVLSMQISFIIGLTCGGPIMGTILIIYMK